MAEPRQFGPEDISAYIDGRGTAAWRAEVAAYLAANPAAAAEADWYRHLNGQLHELRREVLHQPVPPALMRAVRGRAGRRRLPRLSALPAAATIVALIVGTVVGWYARELQIHQPSYIDAVVTQGVYAFGVFTNQRDLPVQFGPDSLDKFNAWAARTFGRAVPPPDLSKIGYSLSGSRVLPASSYTAGYYQFSRQNGPDYAIYFWPERSAAEAIQNVIEVRRGDIDVRLLRLGNIGIALIAETNADQLDTVAQQVAAFYRGQLK